MKIKAAFIFVAPEVDSKKHNAVIDTPIAELKVIGVANYSQAVEVAKGLVDEGVTAIELCAGFGNIGTGMVSEAVFGKATVGSVKFDCHPGFEYKSGDSLFL